MSQNYYGDARIFFLYNDTCKQHSWICLTVLTCILHLTFFKVFSGIFLLVMRTLFLLDHSIYIQGKFPVVFELLKSVQTRIFLVTSEQFLMQFFFQLVLFVPMCGINFVNTLHFGKATSTKEIYIQNINTIKLCTL